MRFAFSAILTLGAIFRYSDAFLYSTVNPITTKFRKDPIVLNTLPPQSDGENSESDDVGGNRFREMLRLAKEEQQRGGSSMEATPRAVENPFLNPPPSTSSPTQLSTNPDELSVEEQARMFREMMAGNQSPQPSPPIRVAKTDRAGRPQGRNPDADKIANSSDLYFAQLKRDSTVRTLGRIRGDDEVSEAVFEDDGIKELDGLFLSNPYLKGQKEEERKMLENLPDEVVAPYFRSDDVDEAVRASSGISYKQRLIEKKQNRSTQRTAPLSTTAQTQEINEAAQADIPATAPKLESNPEPTMSQESTTKADPPEPEQASSVLQESTMPPVTIPQEEQLPTPSVEAPTPITVTSSNDARKQNVRTLMGMILKHRGGPGFGKGRLKGQDVDLFESLVEEITNMLRDEAKLAEPKIDASTRVVLEESQVVSTSNVVVKERPTMVTESTPVEAVGDGSQPELPVTASASTGAANIDSTIACIEGAITMYKNCPPAIQKSVLGTLRAALMAAIETCDVALASQQAPPVVSSTSIEGMIACIEGAVTMYKNSPPVLRESVLVTMRIALMSAVETCNAILQPVQVVPPSGAAESKPMVEPVTPIAAPTNVVYPSFEPVKVDKNTEALENIYEKVQSAYGDGKLGLRSDLTAGEASELSDGLVDMRTILMEELEAGIPDPTTDSSQARDKNLGRESSSSTSQKSSTSSRYQQMLAKARAEKAKS